MTSFTRRAAVVALAMAAFVPAAFAAQATQVKVDTNMGAFVIELNANHALVRSRDLNGKEGAVDLVSTIREHLFGWSIDSELARGLIEVVLIDLSWVL